MPNLSPRPWIPEVSQAIESRLSGDVAKLPAAAIAERIEALAAESRTVHERDGINLNPATNTMNPRAEAMLAAGLGHRPSLGYAGDKYEMGLEAIEEIEVLCAALAAEIFGAKFVEFRVASGALANLYAFMATCKPGDRIIVPPAEIGGHVTHHGAGAAGLYGLDIHAAPVDDARYTVDVAALAELAERIRPRLITIGGSLNLAPHPIAELRRIADRVGAHLLFDAAHMSGPIAGRAWQQPLAEGAHLMTMSTYKSLGGPAGGLVLTDDPALAERLDKIAFPGLTANFDVSKSAALAITLLDWRTHGRAYAAQMVATAKAFAEALAAEGLPVHKTAAGYTQSHQLALEAARFGGGQAAAKRLRQANILACGIGLPIAPVPGDTAGLRLGTNEIVRWGMAPGHMPELARLIARVLAGNEAPEAVAADTTAFRRRFTKLHYLAT